MQVSRRDRAVTVDGLAGFTALGRGVGQRLHGGFQCRIMEGMRMDAALWQVGELDAQPLQFRRHLDSSRQDIECRMLADGGGQRHHAAALRQYRRAARCGLFEGLGHAVVLRDQAGVKFGIAAG